MGFDTLLQAIEDIKRSSPPQFGLVEEFARLFRKATGELTDGQRQLLEGTLCAALLRRRVSWELTVSNCMDNREWAGLMATIFYGHKFSLIHGEYGAPLMVQCYTADNQVLHLQRGQLVLARGRVYQVEARSGSIKLGVSGTTVSILRQNHLEERATSAIPRNRQELPSEDLAFAACNKEEAPMYSARDASYQTAPLAAYGFFLQNLAEGLFQITRTQVAASRAKKYKGSYSVFATSTSETIAKIVIFQSSQGKVNGVWSVPEGVYVMVRVNGAASSRLWNQVLPNAMPQFLRLMRRDNTIGIAPKHSERFAYFRVTEQDDLDRIAALLSVCSTV